MKRAYPGATGSGATSQVMSRHLQKLAEILDRHVMI